MSKSKMFFELNDATINLLFDDKRDKTSNMTCFLFDLYLMSSRNYDK